MISAYQSTGRPMKTLPSSFRSTSRRSMGSVFMAIWTTANALRIWVGMTDAWLSMAGEGQRALPNGRPVDEWGIRMEEGSCNPVGASVSRGGGA